MLKPFSIKLWIAIFLAWSILWIVYNIFFLTSKKINPTDDEGPSFIFSSVTCQGKLFHITVASSKVWDTTSLMGVKQIFRSPGSPPKRHISQNHPVCECCNWIPDLLLIQCTRNCLSVHPIYLHSHCRWLTPQRIRHVRWTRCISLCHKPLLGNNS